MLRDKFLINVSKKDACSVLTIAKTFIHENEKIYVVLKGN